MKWIGLFGSISFLLAISCSKPSEESDNKATNKIDSLTLSKREDIQNFWTFYRQATKDRVEGSWQAAIEGYTKALEYNDRHEDTFYYLGNMYLELSEFQKAEESWNTLLEINPLSSKAHFQLGKLYLNNNATELFDLELATKKFQKTAEINRDFLQPVLHLAQISLIRENYLDCKQGLQIVLGSDDKNLEALFLMGYLDFKQGNHEKALSYFKRVRGLSKPQTPIKGVKGEGDTKTGESLERAINQSLFSEYYKNLEVDTEIGVEGEMQLRFSKLNNFVIQLQNL